MAEKVVKEVWVSDDGEEWDSEEAAVWWDKYKQLEYVFIDVDDIAEHVLLHQDKILRILNDYC